MRSTNSAVATTAVSECLHGTVASPRILDRKLALVDTVRRVSYRTRGGSLTQNLRYSFSYGAERRLHVKEDCDDR
jgi:hypothetical protein